MDEYENYDVTDEQWERIQPQLPPERTGKKGRPRKDDRTMLNGMLWMNHSGAQWRQLPMRYGPWQSVYARFAKWRDEGIWEIWKSMKQPGRRKQREASGASPRQRLSSRHFAISVKTSIPEAKEKISWSMPTYWKGRNLIQFAASKRHIGLYPGPEAVEAFAGRLAEYKTSKGIPQLSPEASRNSGSAPCS